MKKVLLILGTAVTAVAWVLLHRRRKPAPDPAHEVTLTAVRDRVWIMCSCGWDGDDAGSMDDAAAAARRHDPAATIRVDRGDGLETLEPASPPSNPVGVLRI